MTESRQGHVVTFYSYKGGTGRTMALANVAWILASAGKRVLVADWDLESPGLHRFYKPFLDVGAISGTGGVIDLIREFEDTVRRHGQAIDASRVRDLARPQAYAFSLNWEFPEGGVLDFLSAGRQNDHYAASLSGLDWDNFYDQLRGKEFLDALRQHMIDQYDYTLIDSRTGFSDVSDICTGHLPDTLVDCFTLSDQGINGAAQVAANVRNHVVRDDVRRTIRVLPVAMRVDLGEQEKADAGRRLALRSFVGLPDGMSDAERVSYFDKVEVPYRPYFAYEETLATFAERPGAANSLLTAYENLADVVTRGEVTSFARMDEGVRIRWQRLFERPLEEPHALHVLEYRAGDELWAEWIADSLTVLGVPVADRGPVGVSPGSDSPEGQPSRILSIASAGTDVAPENAELRWDEPPPLTVHVTDAARATPAAGPAASLAGRTWDEAAVELARLVGLPLDDQQRERIRSARFPGAEPRWFQAPAQNPRFTGRTADLFKLRRELQSGGEAVVIPTTLHGMGGVGKTQLALEYAHRFRSAYDLVWWISADPPQFVDSALTDLGAAIGVPAERTAVESARSTVASLRQGSPSHRWLLVFDNAEDPKRLADFLPRGGRGHIIITSRNGEWGNEAKTLSVDVFQRPESVAHLRGRVSSLTRDQAEKVAQVVDDLPIAVAVAGAWLADTGTPVDDYLGEIERDGVRALSLDPVWSLSLDRLAERSPGAYRLLQVCSVMAPEIALDLLYSDQMSEHLSTFDKKVSERLMRGSLIQQINKLALLKLDIGAGQAQVHRLLQDAVRRRMTPAEIADTTHQAHLVLAKSRPTDDVENPLTWKGFRMLWPHLDVTEVQNCDDESVRQLLIDRVRYLWRRGDYAAGETFGTKIADIWERRLRGGRSDDPEALERQLLHLRFNVANILRSRARYREALAIDDAILEQQHALLGARHPHTLMTANSRAADLRALGRYAEALPNEEETYRAWNDEFGEDHRRTLTAANNLATSLRAMGDFKGAQAIDDTVWTKRKAVLGSAHPYTLASGGGLGRDLREAGEYERSIVLLRELLATARQELGPDATGTLNLQSNLAVSLRSAGRVEDAALLLEEAYEAFSRRYAPDDPEALACRLNRAANLLATGRRDFALREMEAVTAAYRQGLGELHPFTLVCLSNQSAVHHSQGDPTTARMLVEPAARACTEVLGPGHPYALGAHMNLAICDFGTGDEEGARQRAAWLVEEMGAALGEQHPDTLSCQVNLEIIASRLTAPDGHGFQDGPMPSDSPSLAALSRRLGEKHPTVTGLRTGVLAYRVIDPHDPF